jgi:hypothetical protein
MMVERIHVHPKGNVSMARVLRTIAIAFVMAGAVVGTGSTTASAAECQDSPDPPAVGAGTNSLAAVDAVSRCDAWAVGYFEETDGSNDKALILHWDGTAWKRQPTPLPGLRSELHGVTATSSSNVWAVGTFRVKDAQGSYEDKTLILHWDGASWKRQPSPSPGSHSYLNAVTAPSSSNAWAVGFEGSADYRTVILRWYGTAWKHQKSSNPGAYSNFLEGVSATSPSNAWAVGRYDAYDGYCAGWFGGEWCRSLILHWNGDRWTRQETPGNINSQDYLEGVAATSSTNAWAVGSVGVWHAETETYRDHTLILRWNGTAWKRQQSPNPSAGTNWLKGVAATSSTNAWAVGSHNANAMWDSFVLHWDGTTWTSQSSPYVEGGADTLNGVTATSSTNAWAVGDYTDGSFRCGSLDDDGLCHSFILRSNGTAWSE